MPGSETFWSRPDRVPQLDGVRGIAVSLVVLYHYGSYYSNEAALFPALRWIAHRGWVGVDLFFVLSGFLIGGIAIANREADNSFSTFYFRRFLRIFPLYYFLLIASAIYMWVQPLPKHISLVPYFLYFTNNILALTGEPGPSWLKPAWTLAVEEQFYLLLPAIVALVPPRLLKYVFMAGILVAISLRAAAYLIPLERPFVFSWFLTPCRSEGLCYGVLLALLIRNGAGAISRRALILTCYAVLFASLLGFVVAYRSVDLLVTAGLAMLGPGFFAVVALSILHERGPLALITGTGLLRWIGVRTYAIYLFHVPVFLIIRQLLHMAGVSLFGSAQVLALGVTLLVASVSWRLIEAPLIGVGHRMKYGRGATHPALRPGDPETPSSASEMSSEDAQNFQQGKSAP